MRVLKDLVIAASQTKEINNLRYMLALRTIGRDDGSVVTNNALQTLAVQFGVQPKTVSNRLYICAAKGYGNFNPSGDRFYYYSQERLLQAMGYPLTSKVTVKIDDFSGPIVTVRARFHAALMAAHAITTTVTRSTITNWSGRVAKTQRNYERLNGTKVVANYARLVEYSGNVYDLQRIRYLGYAAFIHKDPNDNKHYITKQLANTYVIPANFSKSSRKVKHPGIIVGSGNVTKYPKVYYENVKAGLAGWAEHTEQNDMYVWNSHANTWEWFLAKVHLSC